MLLKNEALATPRIGGTLGYPAAPRGVSNGVAPTSPVPMLHYNIIGQSSHGRPTPPPTAVDKNGRIPEQGGWPCFIDLNRQQLITE